MKERLLTQPFQIGKLRLKNRMVMPPMNTNYSDIHGSVTPQMVDYFVRRARGGAGLIVIEAASVVYEVKNHGVQPMFYDEKYVPSWNNMVEGIHRYGAKVSIEIVHYGSEGKIGPKVSSSNICSDPKALVTPLSIERIQEIENYFVNAVKNAKKAEFDAVTLHAAHGYLIAEFLSPLYNKRTDIYGGSLENRCRFLLEIINKCKVAVGNDFPIMVRISGDEYIEGGMTIEDVKQIAKLLEDAGIAAIDVSGGVPSTYLFSIAPYSFPGVHGFMVNNAKQIKSVVKIPVIIAGGIRDPEFAEKILAEGSADLIALGRTMIADPDFCNKVMKGDFDDIRLCLTCQNCLSSLDEGRSMRCAINPESGREYEFKDISKADKQKKVAVVGAGPAGLEVARVAAIRGHRVIIIEKGDRIGGAINAGCLPPHKDKLGSLIDWYSKQLKDLGVEVRLESPWNESIMQEIRPDVLIFATGAQYAKFLPGSENAITATEALLHPEKIGEDVVIIGGGATGSETAEFIAAERVSVVIEKMKDFSGELIVKQKIVDTQNKKRITIVEMLDEICSDMDGQNATIMRLKLKYNGVRAVTSTRVNNIKKNCVQVENLKNGAKEEIACDTVILAGGLRPNNIEPVSALGCDIYKIGDCSKPGKIISAIYDGYCLSREL